MTDASTTATAAARQPSSPREAHSLARTRRPSAGGSVGHDFAGESTLPLRPEPDLIESLRQLGSSAGSRALARELTSVGAHDHGDTGSTPASSDGQPVPSIVRRVLARGGGRPLPVPLRTRMEARLGHPFGGVRVHSDALAAESARSVGAVAYTVGSQVVVDNTVVDPEILEGRGGPRARTRPRRPAARCADGAGPPDR